MRLNERHFLELDVFEDAIERLPLEDFRGDRVGEPFLLDSGANPARAFVALGGDGLDFHVEVVVLDLEALRVGDLGQEEELLEAPERRFVRVAADLGLAGTDVGVAQPLLPQARDEAVNRRLLLALDQVGGKVEGSLQQELVEDFATDQLALPRLESAFEDLAQRLSQLGHAIEPDPAQEGGVHFREPELLQVVDLELDLDRLVAQAWVFRGRADHGIGLAAFARLGAEQGGPHVRNAPILEPQFGLEPELDFLDLVERLAVAMEPEVGRHVVADLGPPLQLGDELGVPLQEPRELVVHVGFAQRLDVPIDGQRLVGRQLEIGTDLQVHLELHRPFRRELNGGEVELRRADRVELVVVVELLESGHQQAGLDLIGHLLAEPALDQLPGSAAGAEARHGGFLLHLAERLIELALDFGPGDRDLQVLLARADVRDLNVEVKLALGGFFLDITTRRLFKKLGLGGGNGRIGVVLAGAHRVASSGVVRLGWHGWAAIHAPDAIARKPPPQGWQSKRAGDGI